MCPCLHASSLQRSEKYCVFNLSYGFLKVPIFTEDVSMCYLRARIVVRPSTVSEKWESKGSCVLSSNCCRSLTRTWQRQQTGKYQVNHISDIRFLYPNDKSNEFHSEYLFSSTKKNLSLYSNVSVTSLQLSRQNHLEAIRKYF